tara:strand:- start:20381 stop:20833 length:453 start_codon:yes stop_codon:yes gene_type:complete
MLCGFTSCDFFESKDAKTQKLVNQEMLNIDWNDVDQYPLFSECDETVTKVLQKKCFEETLFLHILSTLQKYEFTVDNEVKDTVYVEFISESNGGITVLNISNSEIFGARTSEFNEKIEQSLNSLPQLEPALKRGIPIRSKFRIPIVINPK